MSKHRKSGKSTKSPRFRFYEKMEAEKNEIKSKGSTKKYNSVEELFKKEKRK